MLIQYSGFVIINFRERLGTKSNDFVMKVISEFGDKACLGASVFFAVHWLGKTEAFTVMTAFSVSVTCLGMFKLYFCEGRPFFLNPEIHPQSCSNLEYGFPSGHTTVTACTYGTLLYCMVRKWPFLKQSLCLQVLGFLALCAFVTIVGFSRLFVGVHSIDQLIVGALIGSALAIYLC